MELYDKATMNGQSTAFPTDIDDGLTKREWFAGMALQGMLANPGNTSIDGCVAMSIFAADSILKQLAESEGASVNWCFWIKIASDEGQAMAFRRFPQTHARELCDAELDREFEYMRDAGFKVDWSAIDPGGMQEIYDMNTEQFKAFGEEVRL